MSGAQALDKKPGLSRYIRQISVIQNSMLNNDNKATS